MTFDEELIDLLKVELEVLRSLKDISFEKTDIIVNNEVEKLENITNTEEELINKIAIIEEERVKLLDNWGLRKDVVISEIIESIPKGKEDLILLKEELENILSDIQSRNLVNNELIMDNLQWLDFNMNLICNAQTPSTYGKGEKTIGNKSLFDRKV